MKCSNTRRHHENTSLFSIHPHTAACWILHFASTTDAVTAEHPWYDIGAAMNIAALNNGVITIITWWAQTPGDSRSGGIVSVASDPVGNLWRSGRQHPAPGGRQRRSLSTLKDHWSDWYPSHTYLHYNHHGHHAFVTIFDINSYCIINTESHKIFLIFFSSFSD